MLSRIDTIKRRLRQTTHLLGQTLQLIWQAARWANLVWAAMLVVQGIIPAAVVYLTKWLVDSIALAVQTADGASWEALMPILVPAALMGSFMLVQQVLGSLQGWTTTYQSEHVQDHIKAVIHDKAAAVDYGFYESSEYYDQMEQAMGQAAGHTLSLLNNIGGLARSTITFLSMAIILISYGWWLPFLLLASTLPAFLVVVRHNQRVHRWWKDTTGLRRRSRYYDLVLTVQRSAAEVRVYGLSTFFRDSYQAIRGKLRTENLHLLRRQAILKLFAGSLALLITAGVMGWILWRSLNGLATLGDLALFYQAFNQGQSLVGTLLRSIGQVYANTLFLEHLFLFLGQKNQLTDPEYPASFPSSLKEGVRFENLTFTYPGNKQPALEQFNLHLPAGKVVAIVGENGAGKSTFVKLLCRFYDPDEGRVSIDGIDLRSMKQQDLRGQISVMFQFPVQYQLTATDNIRLGDLETSNDPDQIMEAAKAAGAHDVISRLPQGYDTQLGRWFKDGSELSGGEWQRIALARAFLRQAQILVLDEPTSFMDSWSELDWMKRFKKLVAGRTGLIITHRFTTAMQADIIYVMDKGQVLESGTHAELLRQGGHYANSWTAQMQAGEHEAHMVE